MWSWSLIIYHCFLLLIILEKLKRNVFTNILPYKILRVVPPIYSQELAIWMQNHWYHICLSLPYILSNKARCSQTIFIFIMVFNLEVRIYSEKHCDWLHVHTWEKENVYSSCYPQNQSILQTTFSLRQCHVATEMVWMRLCPTGSHIRSLGTHLVTRFRRLWGLGSF